MGLKISNLYVHVPFCTRKCDYCAFYSVPVANPDTVQHYLQRLSEDYSAVTPLCGKLNSVYVGGGTPSLLTIPELEDFCRILTSNFNLKDGCEFTFECNPDSVTPDKLELLYACGVNRISLGIQSFFDRHRRTLGRCVDQASIEHALQALAKSKFDNIGMDLIYAIPGQTLEDWMEDVETACRFGVSHLSAYSLTVEEQTKLARSGMPLPDDDVSVRMWDAAESVAEQFGLARYEVSNYAVKDFECRHNQAVWQGVPYVGCGPAAAAFDGRRRWCQIAELKAWLDGAPPELDTELDPRERAAEILAFGMRLCSGWQKQAFQARTGYDMMNIRGRTIEKLCHEGLLHNTADKLVPTRAGLLFADYVAAAIL